MKEFYIVTFLTFLEVILATLLVLELQNQIKKLKNLTTNIEKESKEKLEEFKNFKYELKNFNQGFDEKFTINEKNLKVIGKMSKEIIAETFTGRIFFKKSNVLGTTLKTIWQHKTELFWLMMSFMLINKKNA